MGEEKVVVKSSNGNWKLQAEPEKHTVMIRMYQRQSKGQWLPSFGVDASGFQEIMGLFADFTAKIQGEAKEGAKEEKKEEKMA